MRIRFSAALLCVLGMETGIAQVDFTNLRAGINAPVFDVDGETRLSGDAYLTQLYAGTDPNPAALLAVGAVTPFRTGPGAGYFNGGTVTIPSAQPGKPVFVQVLAWEAACGASYEEALAAGCPVGTSALLQLILPLQPSPPAALTGLQSFQLVQGLQGPLIVGQPRSRLVPPGGTARLNVIAFGSPVLMYQWSKNGDDIAGATSRTLVLEDFGNSSQGNYSVRVSNGAGAVVSQSAQLALPPGVPSISSQPVSQTVDPGGSAFFRVETTGPTPLHYQWRKNGVHLAGQTNAVLAFDQVSIEDGGRYTVEVATEFGAVRSKPAVLLLGVGELAASDPFAERVDLGRQMLGIFSSSNGKASHEPGEPKHAGQPGFHSVWFTWEAPERGIVQFNTRGSTFDTLLAVYEGESVSKLVDVAGDDDRGGFHTSQVRFNVQRGRRYEIAVDGLGGARGEFLLAWGYESTSELLPVIERHPESLTVREGALARLEVRAIGRDLSYQWFFQGAPIPGATKPVLSFPNLLPAQLGSYEVAVFQDRFLVRSRPARLEIGPVRSAQTQDKLVGLLSPAVNFQGGGGGSGGSTLPVTVPVTLGSIDTQIFSNTTDRKEEDELIHCNVISASSTWFALEPTASAMLVLDTIGSDFDTVLAVYQGPSIDTPDFWLLLQIVVCDDNSAPDGIRSQLCFQAEAGARYYVSVDGAGSASGTAYLNWRLIEPQVVVGEGQMVLGTVGTDMVLEPAKTPPAGSALQWFHEGTPLEGQTNDVLPLCNVQLGQAGDYGFSSNGGSDTDLIIRLVMARIAALHSVPPRILVQSTEPVQLQSSVDKMKRWDRAADVPASISYYYDEPDRTVREQRYYRLRFP